MLCSAPNLRTAAISCRMQTTLLTPTSYHTSSSPSTSLRSQEPSHIPARRRVTLAKRHVTFKPTVQCLRQASSISSASSTSSSSSASSSKTPTGAEILDWNTFFKLRKTRRWYQLGSSIGTSFGGFVAGAQVLTRSDMDALVSQIPLDPFLTLGLITFTCGGIGWLAGPILGTGLFNAVNGKYKAQMAAKEKEFYNRVKKYRVDPSASSMANPGMEMSLSDAEAANANEMVASS
ncbi:Pam17-domain-containing protein [Coleophoma cylindrospora]|uniref:Presequence translocated-associated motor subunit PAM17 n=1 Tax=Coleophoma cylindrospora TaxID=1849047 RepID=A0A3D8QSM6_9HELO|nr:Pam17-domain-containing protein [Coleophoma cylindrospora]